MSGEAVVFVGRVLVDSGEGRGNGPARLRVEERLLNAPAELEEVEVNTAAGTSCYMRLAAGRRYVIFATRDSGRLLTGSCTSTFLVDANEHILDALRNQSQGGPAMVVGLVWRTLYGSRGDGPVAGATVTLESGTARYEGVADASGHYEIRGVLPGRYRLDVSKPGFAPDEQFNAMSQPLRWNDVTRKFERDGTSLLVREHRCDMRDLGMWPASPPKR